MMKRHQFALDSQHRSLRVVALMLVGLVSGRNCSALPISLPDVGTDINYNFLAQEPIFEIGNGLPAEEALQGEATFADGKYLKYAAGTDSRFFQIQLILRADGIADLFARDYNPFDETLSLLREDGSISAHAENIGTGFYEDDPIEYSFAWDFHPTSIFSFHGFRWSITPSLVPNALFPDSVSVDTYIWGAGSILIVPEPTSGVPGLVSIIGLSVFARRRCCKLARRGMLVR